jgi:hypothetical protein
MSYGYDATLAAAALVHVRSVDYKVGLRWVFYRLLQDGLLKSKADYARLKDILSDARKNFRDGWAPDTLVDAGRTISESENPAGAADALAILPYYVDIRSDLFSGQPAVPFIVYEAATSDAQFENFAPWCDRAAFRGDASIPHKWAIAKRCDSLAARYELPVHVLYFGDLDKKGLSIPASAMSDVFAWVNAGTSVLFTRVGLNAGDNIRFNLPDKPEKPGTYEWEALASVDAERLVLDGLGSVLDLAEVGRRMEAAKVATGALRGRVAQTLSGLEAQP